ncbi:MAG: SDR family oxidoreductase [Rhodospirillales bacterium]
MSRIIVTGAAGQIGQAITAELVANGHSVVAMDITPHPALTEIAATTPDLLSFLPVDVTDAESVSTAFTQAAEMLGKVDGFVNAVGIISRSPFMETTDTQLERMLQVNLVGALRTSQAAATRMQADGGSIIHIASVHALMGIAGRAAYAASKGGLVAMVRVMATELAEFGITANVIAPGPVGTGMGGIAASRHQMIAATPLGRVAEPSEISGMVSFLLSEPARFITGQVFPLDGGLSSKTLASPDPGIVPKA